MLKVEHLTKRFGELVAVDDLSFHVLPGQIFGIAGPNGAGKSTVYNLISGHYDYQGTIRFNGREITGLPPHRIARIGIARTFQTPQTFPSLTVERSVGVGSRFGSTKGFRHGHVNQIIRFMGLRSCRRMMSGALNLLDKKKLMIGAALASRPRLLMLDEPMAGSNPVEIRELMELIRRINQEMGITVVIIEHFMKVLTELADHLLILESGRQICAGPPDEVTRDPEVVNCYLGDSYAESA
jgi:branched-chain amino acid transport system ATP-binding protein